MREETDNSRSIPASEYTKEYFESCHGYVDFETSRRGDLPRRFQIPLEAAKISPAMRVVDIGCGRGETLLYCAQQGAMAWGLDYSSEATKIAQQFLADSVLKDSRDRVAVQQAGAEFLPFPPDSIDVVLMLDIVEHLYPEQLLAALSETQRILKPGGRLVLHTMPNLWYYHVGYPIFRWVKRLQGKPLPKNPRERWAYSHVHVNEQNPLLLRRTLQHAGFEPRIWLQTIHTYDQVENPLERLAMSLLGSVPPFKWIFCNDIFAIGIKPGNR